MAESILTSINLAGGSFNVYYDTVLDVLSINNYEDYDCPSGWKAAVLISYETTVDRNDTLVTLDQPITIFNISKEVVYYGKCIYVTTGNSTVKECIQITSTNKVRLCAFDTFDNPIGTIIFIA